MASKPKTPNEAASASASKAKTFTPTENFEAPGQKTTHFKKDVPIKIGSKLSQANAELYVQKGHGKIG